MKRSTSTRSIEFPGSGRPPVSLPEGAILSENLTIGNSPVLFGCRTGICGTCLVHVVLRDGELAPPAECERELLAIVAPGDPGARLACQISLTADLSIDVIPQGPS